MKRIVLSTLFALMTLAFNSVAFANPVANLELSCTDGFITANVTIGGPTEGSTLTLTLDPGGETTTIPIENGQGSYSYTFTTPAESGTEYTVTATADDSVTKTIEGCTTTEPTPDPTVEPTPDVTPVTPDPTVEPTPEVTPETPTPVTPTPVTPTPEVTPTPGDDEPGSLVVSKFECTQIEEPTATVSDPVGVASAGEGCVPDAASFEIYVNGDFTSEPIDVFVDGTATVDGLPSTEGGEPHALFEPAFNVFFTFEITPGAVTTITVLNPADDGDGATPIADGDDGTDDGTGDNGTDDGAGDDGTNDGADDDGADEGTNDGTDDGADDGTVDGAGDDGADDGTNDGTDDGAGDDGTDDGTDDGAVSALPSTGQGSDGDASGSAIVLLFGAMSMVALAAGVAWRQRRMI